MIGTGTGLSPYISMMRSMNLGNENQKTAVIHGARFEKDFAYSDELKNEMESRDNFLYFQTCSRPEDPDTWCGMCGRVNSVLEEKLIEKSWGEELKPENTNIYLCGNPEMVKNMTEYFQNLGFKENSRREPGQIFIEKYW